MFKIASAEPDFIATEFRRLVRFMLVGLSNTVVGFSIVALLEYKWGLSPFLANACGIMAGIGYGFMLNAKFVFSGRGLNRATPGRYIIAFVIALGLEQFLLAVFLSLGLPSVPAQGLSLASYSLCYFCLCRFWIFVEPQVVSNLRADHAR